MTLTQVDSQNVSGTFTGSGIDISGITGDWTLKLNVQSLTTTDGSTPQVRFEFDDTVNSFTASLAGPTVSFKGSLGPASDKVKSFKKQDFPDLRAGVTNAKLRLALSAVSANTACQYRAWLEY